MEDRTLFWLATGWYFVASGATLWWSLRDSKRRWASVRKTAEEIHDQASGELIRTIMATATKSQHVASATIAELRLDLARAGRALMSHPQGHDQELIEDAMGWVGEANVMTAHHHHH